MVTYIHGNKDKSSEKIEREVRNPDPLPKVETPIAKRLVASTFFQSGRGGGSAGNRACLCLNDRPHRPRDPGRPLYGPRRSGRFSHGNLWQRPGLRDWPLGLAFADKSTLIVGDGGQEDGADIVRIYTVGVGPLPREKVRKARDMLSFSAPIVAGPDSLAGEGNFYGIALFGLSVFVTCNGDDAKGWIARLELDLKKPAPLKRTPFIKSKELTDTNAPMGATITPDGKLLVCQFGSTTTRPAVLEVLQARLVNPVPESMRLAVEGTNDSQILRKWLVLASTVGSIEAFGAGIARPE